MRLQRSSSEAPDVSMSPLIDCVFLLLIFFLVATMFKKEKKDIDITPPESISAIRLPPDDDVLVLGIDREGALFWEGDASSLNEFHQRLREMALSQPGKRIRLDTDEKTPFRRVAEVLDICQFRGLTNVGIRTYDPRYNR